MPEKENIVPLYHDVLQTKLLMNIFIYSASIASEDYLKFSNWTVHF